MLSWTSTTPEYAFQPLRLATILLVSFLVSECAGQVPGEAIPAAGNPDRRKIVQLISELENTGTEERPAQAAGTFDLVWELSVRNEDPILSEDSGTVSELKAGQHQADAGARARLERIYQRSSVNFRRAYEDFTRARAVSSLAEASKSDNPRDLTRAILRYQYTAIGRNALRNLIQLHISRGESLEAALQFSRYTRLQGRTSPESNFRQAVLWWQSGLQQEAIDSLKNLPREQPAQVTFRGQALTIPNADDDLQPWLERILGAPTAAAGEWTQPFGNYRRTERQLAGPPSLAREWFVSGYQCAECVDCVDDSEINRLIEPIRQPVEERLRVGLLTNETVYPVANPLLTGENVIFRGVAKIRAVNRKSGELVWETTSIDRQLNAALEEWRRRGLKDDAALQSLQYDYAQRLFSRSTRESASGQLSSDGRLVFAVENSVETAARSGSRFAVAPMANFLRAYDVNSGLLKGQAGGMIGASGGGGRATPLAGMYFLGAPLILGEQVFVIAESQQGIFLVTIKLVPLFDDERQIAIRPVNMQLISIPRYSLTAHPVRRMSGLIPSFAQGLLICQTCDEKVVAVSADDHSIRWVYRYSDNVSLSELTRQPVIGNAYNDRQSDESDRQSRWVDSLVRIDNEKVFLTPRDCDRLICIDLKTGAEIWSTARGNMRQLLGVVDGRLILTGTRHVECRAADSGEQLWKYELPENRIAGRGLCDSRVLQIPTTGPSVETLDIRTGRMLLSQSVDGPSIGNLLSADGGFLSQGFFGVSRIVSGADTGSLLLQAKSALLKSDVDTAESVLSKVLESADSQAQEEAIGLMADLLLQSLKLDFEANSDRIPQLQQLMSGMSVSDDDLTDLLASMILMSPGEAAQLPLHWKRVSDQQEKMRQLDALVAQRSFAINQKSAEETAERMIELLEQTRGRSRAVQSPIRTTSWRLAQSSVARGIQEQDEDVREQLAMSLGRKLIARITSAAEPEEAFDWWETGLLCGLATDLAPLAARTDILLPSEYADLVREMTLLEGVDKGGDLNRLFDYWSDVRPESVVSLTRRSVSMIAGREREVVADIPIAASVPRDFAVVDRSRVAAARRSFDRASRQVGLGPWLGRPKVTPGDARVGESPAPLMMASPQRNVPLLGDVGAFANWNFIQRPNDRTVYAFDNRGRSRWKFSPPGGMNSQHVDTKEFSRYAVAYGHVLALKLNSDVFLLECSGANSETSPRTLWSLNVERDISKLPLSQTQTLAFHTTMQYDVSPPGFFPVSELCPQGVAVYAGQTLQLRSLFTGEILWEADGLPDDCRLTCTDKEVLLISRKTGSVECRSLLDGRVTETRSMPEWWDDSNENSSASIFELELSSREVVRWRLTIENGVSLIHAVTSDSSALEAWDIRNGETIWRHELLANSVVSNVVDRHIAVLSAGNMLQLIDLAAGVVVSRHRMPDAGQSMHLYLRKSHDRWMVMTSSSTTDYWDQNPVGYSMLLNGWVCGLSAIDGTLEWTKDIDMEWIKVLSPNQAPMPTVAPLLVLMKRPEVPRGKNGLRVGPVKYTTRVLDVNSGETLFSGPLGLDLSYHCMNLNPEEKTITIGFGIRDVRFDYSAERLPNVK